MTADLSTVDSILKEIYGPRIEGQLQSEVVTLKRIERTSDGVVETVGGKYVDFPIHVKRNTGIGYRNEGEALPTAGRQGYDEVHVPLQYGYGTVKLTAQVMRLAEKNYQAFASAMDREMDGLKDDITKDQNRIVYGDGTGLIATLTGATAGATQNVDNAQWLQEGMLVDVLVKSSGTVTSANRVVESFDAESDPNTVTFDASVTPSGANLDGIYRDNSYGKEPSGFGNIISDTGALHGVDPATQSLWAATVLDNGGTNRALSESLMITGVDKARVKGGKISVYFSSLGVRRAYFNLLTQQRRYVNTKEFAGGFTGLAFNHGREIPVIEDVDAPPNKMWGVDEDKIKIYRDKAWHWADEDGNVLKWVTGFDIFEAYLREFSEKGTSRRNAHVLIDDITEG